MSAKCGKISGVLVLDGSELLLLLPYQKNSSHSCEVKIENDLTKPAELMNVRMATRAGKSDPMPQQAPLHPA